MYVPENQARAKRVPGHGGGVIGVRKAANGTIYPMYGLEGEMDVTGTPTLSAQHTVSLSESLAGDAGGIGSHTTGAVDSIVVLSS